MRTFLLALSLTLACAAPAWAEKTLIESPDAPKAIGPYSQAIQSGKLVFVSGSLPFDPAGKIDYSKQDVSAQTRRVIDNLKVVLGGVGLGLGDVVMARIYLTHFERDYAALNAIWPGFFAPGKLPARTTVGVTGLAVGALVEIDLVARRSQA